MDLNYSYVVKRKKYMEIGGQIIERTLVLNLRAVKIWRIYSLRSTETKIFLADIQKCGLALYRCSS